MKKVALALALLAMAGMARADGVCGDRGRMQDGACLREDSFAIGPGVNRAFLTRWNPANAINSVKIDVLDAASPVQVLELSDMAAHTLELSATDMNFDGYADLMLLANAGATGNTSSMLWVFDPASRNFMPFPKFLELSSPVADPKAQVINTHNKGGNAGLIFIDKTYKWIGGALTKIAEERQDALRAPGYYLNVKKGLVDGHPAVTGERIFKVGDDGTETQVCGPSHPPASCGPVAATIDFTAAEAERDAAGMMAHYAPEVTWQGAPRDQASLRAMHEQYLAGIAEYSLGFDNFIIALTEDGHSALVKCDVTGAYKDVAGKGHAFRIAKQFRLKKSGEKWLIDCEEVSAFLGGARGKTSNVCRLP